MTERKPRIRFSHIGTVLHAELSGEIDHHSAVSLREEADELIFRIRPKTVVIVLSSIEFMDSSGLGLIMGRYALMQKCGATNVRLWKQRPFAQIAACIATKQI